MPAAVDYSDVQGLVRFGFAAMSEAAYLLLQVRDSAAARAWLAQAPVTTAVERNPVPSTALQVAFTRQGLEALQVPQHVLAGFSAEFLAGMADDDNRSRRLGDTGASSPDAWKWGGREKIPHLLVMLFAEPGLLEEWQQSVAGPLFHSAFEEIGRLDTSDLGGREHFGFIDGVSQPQLDWNLSRTVSANGNQLAYGNVVCLGEVLLGYPNEYSLYTERPVLDAGEAGSENLPDAEDQPGKKDLGKTEPTL